MELRTRSVLNTRPRHQAGELTQLLKARSVSVLEFPGVAIRPRLNGEEVREALSRLRGRDWLLFTSANGVRVFADSLSGDMAAIPQGVKIGVVGAGTGRALAEIGLSVAFVAPEASAEGLARSLLRYLGEQESGQEARALLVRSLRGDPVLSELLAEGRVEVESLFVYDSVRPEWDKAEVKEFVRILRHREVDIAVVTSAEALGNLSALCAEEGVSEEWRGLPVAVIGEKTAQVARTLGMEEIIVSVRPELRALCEAIEQFFR